MQCERLITKQTFWELINEQWIIISRNFYWFVISGSVFINSVYFSSIYTEKKNNVTATK